MLLKLMGRDWVDYCQNLIPDTIDYSTTFSMVACPGVLAKVVAGLTGFSPVVIIARSFWNWSSVMAPDCLVPLEDAIGEGVLVLAIDFC